MTQITIFILKSQYFIINISKFNYYQITIAMVPQWYFLANFEYIIILILETFLLLTNFTLICSCFLKAPSDNILTWQHGRYLVSLTSPIFTNPTLSKIEFFYKFYTEHNTIQKVGDSIYYSIVYISKNVILMYKCYSTLIAGLTNLFSNIWNLINTLHMSIIYCKVMHKPNLYTSSNERVTIEIIALLDQKPLKPSRRLRKKPYV